MVARALDVDSVTPYGHGFDYEWVVATAQYAVDPDAPGNQRITDLALAPRDASGAVTFDSDVRVLRPTGEGNGRLLVVVPNRGLLMGLPFSVGADPLQMMDAVPPPGDGFLLRQGWTVAWCGWQWDVPSSPAKLGLRAPVADLDPGWTRLEWRPDEAQASHPLSDWNLGFAFTDYPTASLDDAEAVLTVRTSPQGPRTTVPRSAWHFSDSTHVVVDGGFSAFHWYELVYRTDFAPVVGVGLLAVRDLTARLRRGFDHALAYGVSQTGRFLRQFVAEGLNVDESGAQVFDGVLAHIAGARIGEFNHRYAQPSLTHVTGFSNLPPYDTAGLVARQRSLGHVPRMFFTNTAAEYWRGDAALLHVDPDHGEDLADDPAARHYLLAGNDHIGASGFKTTFPVANPTHQLDNSLVMRALFDALVRWACEGLAPPASTVPTTTAGTLVERAEVLKTFAHVSTPAVDALVGTYSVDLGPQAGHGIGRWPVRLGQPRPALVSAVDADGNEVVGIRLPSVAAPVAAFTGWNPRRPVEGLPDVAYEFVGSQLPFPPGRPTLADRYADRDEYAAAAGKVVDALVAQRFLLADDASRATTTALSLYDAESSRTLDR